MVDVRASISLETDMTNVPCDAKRLIYVCFVSLIGL